MATTDIVLSRGTAFFSMEHERVPFCARRCFKHIKVRFFWLKDLIDDGEIVLIYVLSEELVADMLTKATTGAKFKYLRGKLLGLREDDAY